MIEVRQLTERYGDKAVLRQRRRPGRPRPAPLLRRV